MIIPFYTSSGTAKKTDGQGNLFGVGDFFPVWGIGEGGWYNKTNYTWKDHPEETAIANDDRSKYYGSTKLRKIATELDDLLPDFKAMINQMENQITGESSKKYALIHKLAHREYGFKEKELNQGLIAKGIVPVSYADGRKVPGNVRKAKKIIGVDGPITYKLVPFQNGHNFAYRPIPDKNSGRFFVLVDINPQSFRERVRTVGRAAILAEEEKMRQLAKEKEDSVDPGPWKLARDRYPQQQTRQRVMVGRRNPGGKDDE